MTFKELQAAMIFAMKEKNRVKKEVIADMVACAKNMAIAQGCKDEITEQIVTDAILKSKKICQEQIDTCPANRPDVLEAYKTCMEYINELAPKMMDEKEIKEAVERIFATSSTPLNKGTAMKLAMAELKGKADGKLINQIVTDILKTL